MSENNINKLEEILKEKPNDLSAMVSLGNLYLDEKRFQDAENIWNKAGEKGSAEAFYNLGVLYGMIYLKDIAEDELWELHSDEEMWFEKAEIAYKASLDIDKSNTHALKNLATLYTERGQKKDAIALLEKIIDISNDKDLIKEINEEINEIKSL